ncbi:MAG: hypothetical protein ACO1N9_05155 [Flavobacterium sp.]
MKQEQDYIQDIASIRSMMERSSKFLSLSGWSGILAGVYALIGAGVVYFVIDVRPASYYYPFGEEVIYTAITALAVLFLAISTAIVFSEKKAATRNESIWNPVAKKMLLGMIVPLATGGLSILIALNYGFLLATPAISLIFYGLALFNAGEYTFREIRGLGLIQLLFGFLAILFPEYCLVIWALGFGVMHIIYGAYIHFKYER